MDAKLIISELNARGARFVIHTNIMYGRGINGIDFYSYSQYEELKSGTKIYRTFEPNNNCLVVTSNHEPLNNEPYSRRMYIGYDKITYINEIVED